MVSNPEKNLPKAIDYTPHAETHNGQTAKPDPLLLAHRESINMITARGHQYCTAMGWSVLRVTRTQRNTTGAEAIASAGRANSRLGT